MTTRQKKRKKKKSDPIRFMEELTGGPLTFARLMSSIRLCDEISQAEMARTLGITRAHLCDVEKGRKTVSPQRAAKWAQILGYSEMQFVELAVQSLLEEAGFNVTVHIEAA